MRDEIPERIAPTVNCASVRYGVLADWFPFLVSLVIAPQLASEVQQYPPVLNKETLFCNSVRSSNVLSYATVAAVAVDGVDCRTRRIPNAKTHTSQRRTRAAQ